MWSHVARIKKDRLNVNGLVFTFSQAMECRVTLSLERECVE